MARTPPSERSGRTSERSSVEQQEIGSADQPVEQAVARAVRRLSPQVVLILTGLAGGVLTLGLTAAGAGVYDAVIERDGVAGLDHPLLDQMMAWRSTWVDRLFTAFTVLGGPIGMTVIAAFVTALLCWRWRSWTPLILVAVTVAGSLTFTTVGKAIVGRDRPPLADAVPPYEHSFSFPSGHTLNSTAIAGIVAYLIVRRLQRMLARVLTVAAAALWAVAMGFSRIFLGHHWFTDVLFAWLLGMAWLAVLITAHRLLLSRHPAHR
jgi:undecaprenyl-diphosphatase